jgi:hypothetical protein
MSDPSLLTLSLRVLLAALVVVVLCLPAWWAAGRLPELRAAPSFRLLVAGGAALVAYLTFVNLAGRALQSSTRPATAWIVLHGVAVVAVLGRRRDVLARAGRSLRRLSAAWRSRAPVVVAALVIGAPQWLMAVSTPYWDEVVSSSIHVTAAYQFAEGVFPPRHDAFPDLPIKYHYAVTLLAGTVRWLTGLTPNVSIDVVSTGLWLFVFLFAFHWLEQLRLRRVAALSGASAILLGGGLSWLYLPRVETYTDFYARSPGLAVHHHDAARGWLANLIGAAKTPVFHLRNADGTLSDLPWDVAYHFQQHAVALGIALTLFAAWLLCAWLRRDEPSLSLLAASVAAFGLIFLAHAVFGAVAAVAAGLTLAGRWLLSPSRRRLAEAAAFTAGVSAVAFAHGGVLSRGAEYGTELAVLTLRHGFGYSAGGVPGFLHWNLAAFGAPLLLALVALAVFLGRGRALLSRDRALALSFFATLLLASYLPPQILYYSYGEGANEEFTEVSKFFFVTHLALGVLSAFGVAALLRGRRWVVVGPLLAAMPIVPLANVYASCFDGDGAWLGFYRSPYPEATIALARRFQELKKSSRDVFYTARGDTNYLDPLLTDGGSAFTVTPLNYELTGAYMIAEPVVAERLRRDGLMARLHPGAEAASGAAWYSVHAARDLARAPVVVRSRFEQRVREGRFVEAARVDGRVLYRIEGGTADVDEGVERSWRPTAVLQAPAGREGLPLAFYDHRHQQIIAGEARTPLPPWCGRDLVQVWTARLAVDHGGDFLVAGFGDTLYHRGRKLDELEVTSPWLWSFTDGDARRWRGPNASWTWDYDIPLVADVDGRGVDTIIAFRTSNGEWIRDTNGPALAGPPAAGVDLPVPVAGRFHDRSRTDLALWSASTGAWVVAAKAGDAPSRFLHGAAGDVLVPGDYDGDGRDEAVVWRRSDLGWYARDVVTRVTTRWTFGSPSAVPLPADYDHDGRLDLAYWEPAERKIFVSFTHGASVDRVIEVPKDAIPVFVNMY